MNKHNSGKKLDATTPQSSEGLAEISTPVIRHLGFIKVMAIIMALLIIVALVVIVLTIYSRLTSEDSAEASQQSELFIPSGSSIVSASLGEKGQMLLLILDKTGQQIWQLNRNGKVQRKTLIVKSP